MYLEDNRISKQNYFARETSIAKLKPIFFKRGLLTGRPLVSKGSHSQLR